MKNKTLQTALEIGFDFENADFNTREELESEVLAFLHENVERLEIDEDEQAVRTTGRDQSVSYGDWTSSGDLVDHAAHKPGDRVYHSAFLHIREDGTPVHMRLYETIE